MKIYLTLSILPTASLFLQLPHMTSDQALAARPQRCCFSARMPLCVRHVGFMWPISAGFMLNVTPGFDISTLQARLDEITVGNK